MCGSAMETASLLNFCLIKYGHARTDEQTCSFSFSGRLSLAKELKEIAIYLHLSVVSSNKRQLEKETAKTAGPGAHFLGSRPSPAVVGQHLRSGNDTGKENRTCDYVASVHGL